MPLSTGLRKVPPPSRPSPVCVLGRVHEGVSYPHLLVLSVT